MTDRDYGYEGRYLYISEGSIDNIKEVQTRLKADNKEFDLEIVIGIVVAAYLYQMDRKALGLCSNWCKKGDK